MDKQTPTQIASEIIRNRNNIQKLSKDGQLLALKYGGYNNIPIAYCYNYEDYKDNAKKLDFINHKILAYRTAWEDELEKLDNYRKLISIEDDILYEQITKDMIELTSALKILEGEQK